MDGACLVITRILNPHFLGKVASYDVESTILVLMASYDVASIIHQSLARGGRTRRIARCAAKVLMGRGKPPFFRCSESPSAWLGPSWKAGGSLGTSTRLTLFDGRVRESV
jgi:hypothetical protein